MAQAAPHQCRETTDHFQEQEVIAVDPSITYFPVANGDTSLITLSDGTTILIDCSLSQDSEDEEVEERYDVRAHLLTALKRDGDGCPHLNAFILTHPDQDHLLGLTRAFYLGDPAKYGEEDAEEDRVIIDELWFAPRIFSPHEKDLCEEAKAYRKETKRRISVYRTGTAASNKAGNRLRVIGYSDNEELDGLDAVLTVPGNVLNRINGSDKADFSFFVHAPRKKDTDSKWSERNDTSIILQARFAVNGEADAALAFFGGDAGCGIWEQVVDSSKNPDLTWDLFLAPHHCSWTFFCEPGTGNDDKKGKDDEDKPRKTILSLLRKKRRGAWVTTSSKPIKDDDNNPPHYKAAQVYRDEVGKDHFLCTMEHLDEEAPQPITFTMSANGPIKEQLDDDEASKAAGVAGVFVEPAEYG